MTEIRMAHDGRDTVIECDGVVKPMIGLRLGDLITSSSPDELTVWKYEITGEGGVESLAWLKDVMPGIMFLDPIAERVKAYAAHVERIEDRATARVVQQVVDLWNLRNGWIPGADYKNLADALGVDPARLTHYDADQHEHVTGTG